MTSKVTVEKNIVLYDIKTGFKPHRQWSLNTTRTRVLFNYLGIPFETHWLAFPDVTPFLEQNSGLTALKVPEEAIAPYTVPAINDGGKFVMDSDKILDYTLSKFKIPRSKIIPNEDFYKAFTTYGGKVLGGFAPVAVAFTEPILESETSKEAFAKSKAKVVGRELISVREDHEFVTTKWQTLVKELHSFESLKAELQKNGLPTEHLAVDDYLYGDKLSYADIILFGFIYWVKVSIDGGSLKHVKGITAENFLSPWLNQWYDRIAVYNLPN